MRIFISGATGFIGAHLVEKLAGEGHRIHALIRNEAFLPFLDHPNITPFMGSLDQPGILEKAIKGSDQVYHIAALTLPWIRDSSEFFKFNLEGAGTIFELALKHKVKKVVFTSTAGVTRPSNADEIDEKHAYSARHFTAYEASKAEAEKLALSYFNKGLDIVIVRPTRVFGPGRAGSSNAVARMIELYAKGKWHFIPGNGKCIANYVLVHDVVEGHVLAMQKGRAGEVYILGGENVIYNDFFKILRECTGKKYRLFRVPYGLMTGFATMTVLWARISGKVPLITPAHVRKFNQNWKISSAKAAQELDYHPKNLRQAFQTTLEWLKENGRIA